MLDSSRASLAAHLLHEIEDASARHELEDNAEVGLPSAGPDELDYILVPHLPHDRHFLHSVQHSRG